VQIEAQSEMNSQNSNGLMEASLTTTRSCNADSCQNLLHLNCLLLAQSLGQASFYDRHTTLN
jgi:hypothetical protein